MAPSKSNLWRFAVVFLLGAAITFLVMRTSSFRDSEVRYNARIGRYQLKMGKVQYGGAGPDVIIESMFRIDTTTGQTWNLQVGPTGLEMWKPIIYPSGDAQFMVLP